MTTTSSGERGVTSATHSAIAAPSTATAAASVPAGPTAASAAAPGTPTAATHTTTHNATAGPCRYFLKSVCKHGALCRFKHVLPSSGPMTVGASSVGPAAAAAAASSGGPSRDEYGWAKPGGKSHSTAPPHAAQLPPHAAPLPRVVPTDSVQPKINLFSVAKAKAATNTATGTATAAHAATGGLLAYPTNVAGAPAFGGASNGTSLLKVPTAGLGEVDDVTAKLRSNSIASTSSTSSNSSSGAPSRQNSMSRSATNPSPSPSPHAQRLSANNSPHQIRTMGAPQPIGIANQKHTPTTTTNKMGVQHITGASAVPSNPLLPSSAVSSVPPSAGHSRTSTPLTMPAAHNAPLLTQTPPQSIHAPTVTHAQGMQLAQRAPLVSNANVGGLSMHPLARAATQPHPHGHAMPSPPPPHHTMHAPMNAQPLQVSTHHFHPPQAIQSRVGAGGAARHQANRGPNGPMPHAAQQAHLMASMPHITFAQSQPHHHHQSSQQLQLFQQGLAQAFFAPPMQQPAQPNHHPQQSHSSHMPPSFTHSTVAVPNSRDSHRRSSRPAHSNEVCRFWLNQTCRYMNEPAKCTFAHAMPTEAAGATPPTPATASPGSAGSDSQSSSGSATVSPLAPPIAAPAAPVVPLAPFGGWLAHDRVHHFRGLVVLEKANVKPEELATAKRIKEAADAAAAAADDSSDAAAKVVLLPPSPLPAAHYRSTLLVYAPAHVGLSFQSLVHAGDHRAVKLIRDLVALLETEHHLSDYHLSVIESRSAIMDERELASLSSAPLPPADPSAASSVLDSRAFVSAPTNFHFKIHFGGICSPLPVRDGCISCDDKENGSLIEPLMYNNVWLDAQGRPMVVVTPHSHHERITALTDAQLHALYQDAYAVLKDANKHVSESSRVSTGGGVIAPFAYDALIINQGLYRNHAHLHLKARISSRVWTILTTDGVTGTGETAASYLHHKYADQMKRVESSKHDPHLKKSTHAAAAHAAATAAAAGLTQPASHDLQIVPPQAMPGQTMAPQAFSPHSAQNVPWFYGAAPGATPFYPPFYSAAQPPMMGVTVPMHPDIMLNQQMMQPMQFNAAQMRPMHAQQQHQQNMMAQQQQQQQQQQQHQWLLQQFLHQQAQAQLQGSTDSLSATGGAATSAASTPSVSSPLLQMPTGGPIDVSAAAMPVIAGVPSSPANAPLLPIAGPNASLALPTTAPNAAAVPSNLYQPTSTLPASLTSNPLFQQMYLQQLAALNPQMLASMPFAAPPTIAFDAQAFQHMQQQQQQPPVPHLQPQQPMPMQLLYPQMMSQSMPNFQAGMLLPQQAANSMPFGVGYAVPPPKPHGRAKGQAKRFR